MQIFLSPVVPFDSENRLTYKFEGDQIICTTSEGVQDSFDFSEFPDGVLEMSIDGNDVITTKIEPCPIQSVSREDGELYVTLLHYVDGVLGSAEMYPNWIPHTEYETTKDV